MKSATDEPTRANGVRAGRYAAIDIGTVTCRMLVADVDDAGELHELDREYAITNLGEDVDRTHHLKPAAIERVARTVGGFLDVLRSLEAADGVRARVIAFATSASRDADNAAEFEQRIADLGVTVTVIPGSREAELSFSGASSCFPGESVVVVDVGGGSTEISAGEAGARPVQSHSFDIGCRRVTEKFLHTDPPTASELDDARAWVRAAFSDYFRELRERGISDARLVAVAGTATTVVSVREAMEVYDSARVHKAHVSAADLDALFARMAQLPLAERRKVRGLDPGRAPVITAGLLILQEVLAAGSFGGFTVSESDILQGVILYAAQNAAGESTQVC